MSEVYYAVHVTRILDTARISNVESVMFVDRNNRDVVRFQLDKDLLKSATVTSFSQLHLSCNSGSGRSLDQINLHFLALHTRRLIKKAKKYEKISRFFVGMENFALREIRLGEKSMGKS